MSKLKFIMVTARDQYASIAALMIGGAIREAIEDGYICSGSMLVTSERRGGDAFTQTILIQPMTLEEKQ